MSLLDRLKGKEAPVAPPLRSRGEIIADLREVNGRAMSRMPYQPAWDGDHVLINELLDELEEVEL